MITDRFGCIRRVSRSIIAAHLLCPRVTQPLPTPPRPGSVVIGRTEAIHRVPAVSSPGPTRASAGDQPVGRPVIRKAMKPERIARMTMSGRDVPETNHRLVDGVSGGREYRGRVRPREECHHAGPAVAPVKVDTQLQRRRIPDARARVSPHRSEERPVFGLRARHQSQNLAPVGWDHYWGLARSESETMESSVGPPSGGVAGTRPILIDICIQPADGQRADSFGRQSRVLVVRGSIDGRRPGQDRSTRGPALPRRQARRWGPPPRSCRYRRRPGDRGAEARPARR